MPAARQGRDALKTYRKFAFDLGTSSSPGHGLEGRWSVFVALVLVLRALLDLGSRL
jgi:hypothetical protein